MWKSIVLCVSLFGGAAMGLALGAQFIEASALPAAAAIGLCLIGVTLILAAPTAEAGATMADEAANTMPMISSVDVSEQLLSGLETPMPMAAVTPVVKNRTPSMPFEVLNT